MNCPICKSSSDVSLKFKEVEILICKGCGHRFSNVSADSSIYKEDYFSSTHKNFFENCDTGLFNYIMEKITEYKGKHCNILDIGCGNGSLLKFLSCQGFSNLTGIDLIENKHNGINFIKKDFYEYDNIEKFDVVLCIYSIEHMDNMDKYMFKIEQLLKEDGIFIVSTINDNSLIYSLSRGLYALGIGFACERLYSKHHLNHFSVNSLKLLVKNRGFKLLSLSTKNFPCNALDFSESLPDKIVKSVVMILFLLSAILKKEFCQTQVLGR